jgi:hypothetical protein
MQFTPLTSVENIVWGLPVKMTSTNACSPARKICSGKIEICSFCSAAFTINLAAYILILLK